MALPGKPASKTGKPLPAGGRPNTLGLGQRELADLLDRMEDPDHVGANPKRDFVRWPFRQTSVKVQIFHTGGTTATITVACRNISRAGMSLLHSSYLHTGTKCRVLLPHPERGEMPMDGWITRCNHRVGVVHEIGIRFDQHLDVQEFLRPNPFTDWFSLERVKPEDLTGNVVCVDDSEIDRRIIKHLLRNTALNCVMACSGAEGLTTVDESTDLVLVDYHLGDMSGAEFTNKLRDAGLQVPVIILTCDTQTATAEILGSIQASAFLAKPVSQDLLLRALGEFLIVRKANAEMQPKVGDDTFNSSLTEGLVTALGQYAKRLEDCIERQDATTARTLCLQIAGTAGTVGFKDVSQVATKASEALSRSMSTTESISPIRTLIAVCQRASSKTTKRAG